jgi:hypothetical protein
VTKGGLDDLCGEVVVVRDLGESDCGGLLLLAAVVGVGAGAEGVEAEAEVEAAVASLCRSACILRCRSSCTCASARRSAEW